MLKAVYGTIDARKVIYLVRHLQRLPRSSPECSSSVVPLTYFYFFLQYYSVKHQHEKMRNGRGNKPHYCNSAS